MKKKRNFRVKEVLGVYFAHARRYPVTVTIGVVLTAGAFVFSTIVPLIYKQLIDTAAANPEPNALAASAMQAILYTAVAVMLLRFTVRRGGSVANTFFQPRIMRDLGNTAFSYLIDHSYRFFANNFTGTLVRRVVKIQNSFEDFADRMLYDFIPIIVTITGAGIVLFSRHWILGSLFLGWVVIFLVVQFGVVAWKMKYNVAVAEKDSEVVGVLSDAVANDVTIKTFASEDHERGLFAKVSQQLSNLRFKSWMIDEAINMVQGLLMILIEFLLFFGLIYLWAQGQATVGDFILVQSYVILAIDRLWDLGQALRRLYASFADATEMVEIMLEPHEIKDAPNAATLKVSDGAIAFNKVEFRFHENRAVLTDFDLAITGQEKVALVGPSGAGKTTITKLLLRFHDINGGELTIDGQDIRKVTQRSLREAVAFVPQEPILFHRTLMENIRYGRKDATDEEVIAAAEKAHCMDFIAKAPEGFKTYVGERGIKLSGGERQRIAIARAILKDAPILVLDEATSSLDSESEALIQDALTKLMEGKTVIAIAHRLSTVMKMDRIIVIEDGKVVTSGTHDDLVAHEGGLYKKLWEIQAGGFLTGELK
ncbi:MAG: ABC transporter ATP-binding protein [Candidatus Pacebacteria bacterium]|nr:ABC transporter ATP-binding protein [Candidatus Paceibacterota bacterium]